MAADALSYLPLHGAAIRTQLESLAALRLAVFRDWPYLYDGSMEYERRYLESYAACFGSLVVLALDGDRCVGATTALPLRDAPAEMREPFERRGLLVDRVLYFGESVVHASHRGRGIGLRFFEARESHARALGLGQCAFCAVDRPDEHPLKPKGHLGNDRFWRRRGYKPRPDLVCRFDWQDVGDAAPSSHTLTYWLKTL